MQLMFDIAVGKCESIDQSSVTVRLDSAIVSRLIPGRAWSRSGTSILKISLRLCSERRPPKVGSETFLQREALLRNPLASLDLLGDGEFTPVRLRSLGTDTDPQLPEAAPVRGKADRAPSRPRKDS